jgi:hypothetical protein
MKDLLFEMLMVLCMGVLAVLVAFVINLCVDQ